MEDVGGSGDDIDDDDYNRDNIMKVGFIYMMMMLEVEHR